MIRLNNKKVSIKLTPYCNRFDDPAFIVLEINSILDISADPEYTFDPIQVLCTIPTTIFAKLSRKTLLYRRGYILPHNQKEDYVTYDHISNEYHIQEADVHGNPIGTAFVITVENDFGSTGAYIKHIGTTYADKQSGSFGQLVIIEESTPVNIEVGLLAIHEDTSTAYTVPAYYLLLDLGEFELTLHAHVEFTDPH